MLSLLMAISLLADTTIGVGLFGLPYVASKIGFVPMLFYFIFLTVVVLSIQLMYGEVIVRSKRVLRLPGYARQYLGLSGGVIAAASASIGFTGANLAYLVIGGFFLYQFFSPLIGGTEAYYVYAFFVSGSLIVYLGSRSIALSSALSMILFYLILGMIVVIGAPHVKVANLSTIDWTYLLLPYGVILFAMSGMSILPEMYETVKKQKRLFKLAIVGGTIIPAITYILFIVVVLGVSGPLTTQDALAGLETTLGNNILKIGYLFGFVSTFTSYLILSLVIKKIYSIDFGIKSFYSWSLACLLPPMLYAVGVSNFIAIIGFTGAVTSGIDGILTLVLYRRVQRVTKPQALYHVRIPLIVLAMFAVLLLSGIILGGF